MIGRGLALVSVCSLAYLLYLPLPDGYEEPWKTRLTLYKMGAMSAAISAVNTICGYDHPLRFFQIAMDEYIGPAARIQPLPGLKVTDETFDGVRVRVYDPEGREANSPAVIYIHGGGWVICNINLYDPVVQPLALKTNVLFVSVEYRLAPDYKYPTPVDDCMAAVKYFLKNAAAYKVDPNRVAVAGDSAGGHLSAVVSMKLRDENFPSQPVAQLLIYPVTQAFDFKTSSYRMNGNIPSLPTNLMLNFWALFHKGEVSQSDRNVMVSNKHVSKEMFSKHARKCNPSLVPSKYATIDRTSQEIAETSETQFESMIKDPYMSPLLADDLSGLPKAFVITAELDVLRDDGLMYVTRLREAGNDVVHHHYVSSFHGFFSNGDLEVRKTAVNDFVKFIKENV